VSANTNFQIQGIDYLSPGFTPFGGGPLLHGADPSQGGFTKRWHENGFMDSLVNFTAADQSVTNNPLGADCGHSVACALNNDPKFDSQVETDLQRGTNPCDNPMVFSRKHKPHPLYGGGGGGGPQTNGGGVGLPSCQLYLIGYKYGEGLFGTTVIYICFGPGGSLPRPTY